MRCRQGRLHCSDTFLAEPASVFNSSWVLVEGTYREERDKEQSARHAAPSSERHQELRRHESRSLVTVQVERVGGECDGNKGRRLWETRATSDPGADRSITGRGRL